MATFNSLRVSCNVNCSQIIAITKTVGRKDGLFSGTEIRWSGLEHILNMISSPQPHLTDQAIIRIFE